MFGGGGCLSSPPSGCRHCSVYCHRLNYSILHNCQPDVSGAERCSIYEHVYSPKQQTSLRDRRTDIHIIVYVYGRYQLVLLVLIVGAKPSVFFPQQRDFNDSHNMKTAVAGVALLCICVTFIDARCKWSQIDNIMYTNVINCMAR